MVIIVVVSKLGDIVSKNAKARIGAQQGASARELDEMHRRLDDQAALLSETQGQVADQNMQIEELHERVEFAERLLSRVRNPPVLEPGETKQTPG